MNEEVLYAEIELLSFALQNGSTKCLDDNVDASYFTCDEHQFNYSLFKSFETTQGELHPVAVLHYFEMTCDKLLTEFFQTGETAELGQQIFEHLAFLGGYTNYSLIEIKRNDQSIHGSEDEEGWGRISSFRDIFNDLILKTEQKEKLSVLKTGLTRLDAELGGLERGIFSILGGEPGLGKSFLAQQVTLNNAREGISVGLLPLEMKKTKVMQRYLPEVFGKQDIEKSDLYEIRKNRDALLDLPIFLTEQVYAIDDIEYQVDRLVRKNGIQLLIIDYLQLIENGLPWHSRTESIGDTMRRIARFTREYNLATIMISSLTIKGMAGRFQRVPTIMDIRDSGDVPYDADNILFLWKPIPKDALYRELIIPKIKNGSPSSVPIYLRFDPERLMFRETEKQKGERMLPDAQSLFRRKK